MNIEELFLEAEADIKKSAHVDALRKFETILYDVPNHAPTHNSLGWLYKTQFDDYKKAETHFKTAIKAIRFTRIHIFIMPYCLLIWNDMMS